MDLVSKSFPQLEIFFSLSHLQTWQAHLHNNHEKLLAVLYPQVALLCLMDGCIRVDHQTTNFCTVSVPRSFLFKVAFWRLKVVRWSRDIKCWSPMKKEKTLGVILHEGLYRRPHWLQVLHFLCVLRKAFPSTRPPSTELSPQFSC